jgi:hypothetical protein
MVSSIESAIDHRNASGRILCQHERGSCAACCGIYNFRNRDRKALENRLTNRTEKVLAAYPNESALAKVAHELQQEEQDDILFPSIRVCPFAGYVEQGRVGCLVHPRRHPEGQDLRHLGVYESETCETHYCAPHDWLRPREADFAQTAEGSFYGRVVTDAGLIKSLVKMIEARIGAPLKTKPFPPVIEATQGLWRLLEEWPFRDPDPNRFGGFYVTGDDAAERTLPGSLSHLQMEVDPSMLTVLDALASQFDNAQDGLKAIRAIEEQLDKIARAIERIEKQDLVLLKKSVVSKDEPIQYTDSTE